MERSEHAVRVTFVQPSLAKYRVPVFRELASRPGFDLRVVYGSLRNLPNVIPAGFHAALQRQREFRIAGMTVTFHGAEWTYSSRRLTDVLVLRWSPRSASLLPALVRANLAGVPTVLWGHGYSKDERGPRTGVRQWLARRASAIVFYDPITRDSYIRSGWDPSKLFVAPNSLEDKEITEARQWWLERPDRLAAFRVEQRLGNGPVILFVSRLQPANRIDMLIRATAQLIPECRCLKTVIIGSGTDEKQRLQALARSEGAADNVIFVEGIYDELKLAPWFLLADLFCYPANIGLSLIHAFWYGLPVVTSDHLSVHNPEIVALESGVNGLTYKHRDVSSLADAMHKIISTPALKESMSQAAQRTVRERFTIPRMVDGLEAAIRYVLPTM